jgi:hypothetical protein
MHLPEPFLFSQAVSPEENPITSALRTEFMMKRWKTVKTFPVFYEDFLYEVSINELLS